MTIINRTHRFLYVHVPKTAGTSVKMYLGRFGTEHDLYLDGVADSETLLRHFGSAPPGLHKHARIRDIVTLLGPEELSRFVKISVVRNPFDRTISTFKFLKYKFRKWPKSNIMERFDTLQQFVLSDFFRHQGPGRIFQPQTWWLTLNGEGLCIDFLGRYESLDDDLSRVCRKLNLAPPKNPIERKNVSAPPGTDEQTKVTPVVVDAVRAKYATDFDLLGYPLEPEQNCEPKIQLTVESNLADENAHGN